MTLAHFTVLWRLDKWHFYDAFVGGFNGSLLYGPINELVVEYEVFDNMMNFWGNANYVSVGKHYGTRG